jgi:hypothetical protein
MKRPIIPFLLAIIGSLVITVFGLSHALLERPPYARAVQGEQHPRPDSTREARNLRKGPIESGEDQDGAQRGADEGTEFWAAFLGYRLKVTDTLIAAFTALLFLATVALWLATRNLVRGAERTSEQQLRAYVYTETTPLRLDQANLGVETLIKNSGQTPAYEVRSWTETLLVAEPPPRGFVFKGAPKRRICRQLVTLLIPLVSISCIQSQTSSPPMRNGSPLSTDI